MYAMDLQIYSKKNCSAVKPGTSTIRFLKAGSITLSKRATEAIELNKGDKILFVQDKNRPMDWYITKELNSKEEGFALRKLSHVNGLTCNCAYVCKKLFDSLKDKVPAGAKSISAKVSEEPTEIDGVKYYAIITKGIHVKNPD